MKGREGETNERDLMKPCEGVAGPPCDESHTGALVGTLLPAVKPGAGSARAGAPRSLRGFGDSRSDSGEPLFFTRAFLSGERTCVCGGGGDTRLSWALKGELSFLSSDGESFISSPGTRSPSSWDFTLPRIFRLPGQLASFSPGCSPFSSSW